MPHKSLVVVRRHSASCCRQYQDSNLHGGRAGPSRCAPREIRPEKNVCVVLIHRAQQVLCRSRTDDLHGCLTTRSRHATAVPACLRYHHDSGRVSVSYCALGRCAALPGNQPRPRHVSLAVRMVVRGSCALRESQSHARRRDRTWQETPSARNDCMSVFILRNISGNPPEMPISSLIISSVHQSIYQSDYQPADQQRNQPRPSMSCECGGGDHSLRNKQFELFSHASFPVANMSAASAKNVNALRVQSDAVGKNNHSKKAQVQKQQNTGVILGRERSLRADHTI